MFIAAEGVWKCMFVGALSFENCFLHSPFPPAISQASTGFNTFPAYLSGELKASIEPWKNRRKVT